MKKITYTYIYFMLPLEFRRVDAPYWFSIWFSHRGKTWDSIKSTYAKIRLNLGENNHIQKA